MVSIYIYISCICFDCIHDTLCFLSNALHISRSLHYNHSFFRDISTAEEEEKRARERERMKAYQDRIYQENLDDIERKARNKLQSFAEDKYVPIRLSVSVSPARLSYVSFIHHTRYVHSPCAYFLHTKQYQPTIGLFARVLMRYPV